jgi:medium-chain acyl-[acyl-carrier-protein] hydrolase
LAIRLREQWQYSDEQGDKTHECYFYMAEMELRVFRQSAQVSFFDADVKLRMSPGAYWRVLQNAAAGHASILSAATEELRKSGQTWMLSKMRVDVDRHLMLGESLSVETWPSTRIKGARAYRDYVLKDGNGEICARASSLWVIVDLASRRPVRIPDAIVALCADPGYLIPAVEESWLLPPVGEVSTSTFRACWSDADQNEHVNNVAMVRWAVDAMPLAFLEQHEVVSIEAHYRAEVSIGAEVLVQTHEENGVVKQAVLNEGVMAALVHSTWRRSDAAPVAP